MAVFCGCCPSLVNFLLKLARVISFACGREFWLIEKLVPEARRVGDIPQGNVEEVAGGGGVVGKFAGDAGAQLRLRDHKNPVVGQGRNVAARGPLR